MAGAQSRIDRSGEANVNVVLNPDDLKALKRSIRESGPAGRRALRARLKIVGEMVRDEIRGRTPVAGKKYGGKGRQRVIGTFRRNGGNTLRTAAHTAGLLKRSTKVKISTLSVAVYNDAKAAHRGGFYRYGKRLEFDPKYAGRYAFFYPGWEAKKPAADAEFRKVLDDVEREYAK